MSRLRQWRSTRRAAEDSSGFDLARMRAWTDPHGYKTAASPETPPPLKTRIAREVAVEILLRAGQPMTWSEVMREALADHKVVAAGIPRGTVTAQLSAALAENPRRIVRLSHGIYAAAGLEIVADSSERDTATGTGRVSLAR